MNNPIEWAKLTVKKHGPAKAYSITQTTGREKIGTENSISNPFFKFYQNASLWIKKHYLNDLEKKPTMKEFMNELPR